VLPPPPKPDIHGPHSDRKSSNHPSKRRGFFQNHPPACAPDSRLLEWLLSPCYPHRVARRPGCREAARNRHAPSCLSRRRVFFQKRSSPACEKDSRLLESSHFSPRHPWSGTRPPRCRQAARNLRVFSRRCSANDSGWCAAFRRLAVLGRLLPAPHSPSPSRRRAHSLRRDSIRAPPRTLFLPPS